MQGKTESVAELADTNKENLENNGQQKEETAPKKSSKFRAVIHFLIHLTVEPFLFLYILPNAVSSAAVQRLNIEKACRSDLNYSEAICLLVRDAQGNDNITIEAQGASTAMVADMYSWIIPLQSSVPTIIVLFVGAWSDRTGNRKILMLIPLIGEIIFCFGLILATYFFLEWPLWATGLIEALPSALSGGTAIAFMGSFSYIADVTTLEARTFRMGFITVIVQLSGPIGSAISGVLLEAVGYYGVFSIAMALYVIGFIHTYYRVHNVRNDKMEGTLLQKIVDFIHPRNAWDSISILFVTPWKQRRLLILIILAQFTILGPNIGEANIKHLYAFSTLNMSVVDFSFFSTYSSLISIAGLAVGVPLFSKYFKLHDTILGIISGISQIISSIVFGMATTVTWFYFGPLFGFFANNGVTVTRSLSTKVVDPDKVGKMFSILGLSDSLVLTIYPPIFTKLFSNTLNTFPGAAFYLGAILTVPPLAILGMIYVLDKRRERDVVKNPDSKEMHAHDNQMTTL